ncbi:hypothetical protein GCM10022222_84810 [Amycolatopsis ultiminotia]|uniref:DUF222 domain-containing protein n=1 Tax=Amycolatopsis ultiminotia TaxID=543629 RepID=A0ABP6YQF7_9PSEU
MAKFSDKYTTCITDAVKALEATPPRVRTALTELRRAFERSDAEPPALLTACAELLRNTQPLTGSVLSAVTMAHTAWHEYTDLERRLYSRCVYSTTTRHDVTAHEPNDVTVMLRENPPRIDAALQRLRWLNAATLNHNLKIYSACAALLKDPSADSPAVTDAVTTAHTLWPDLDQHHRTLITSCIYVSKPRAEKARRAVEQRQRQTEAGSGDIHRCNRCDEPIPGRTDLVYCSDTCRADAENETRPTPVADAEPPGPTHAENSAALDEPAPAETRNPVAAHPRARPKAPKATGQPARTRTTTRKTAEQRAQERDVRGPVEVTYDEHYRQVDSAISPLVLTLKDERAADQYEGERRRELDLDHTRDDNRDTQGTEVTDEDRERDALRGIDPQTLCVACRLARTPAEQRDPDGRCTECQERGAAPLSAVAVA